MNDISFTHIAHPAPVTATRRAELLEDPGFGRVFTDHMATIRYKKVAGWHDAKLEPRMPIPMDPASAVLHCAQEIFEGLKAYRTPVGGVTLFRPDANGKRFQRSAARLAMPLLPEALFIAAVEGLVKIDHAWIPSGDRSLYIRPFMFATDAILGVKASSEYLFTVIASPVAGYFNTAAASLRVWVTGDYSRAAAGGTGAAKCGGNYAASIIAQAEGTRQGCDQVVFLDAAERCWIEELGGMNIFFAFNDGSLLTPPLNGNILAGITRDSLLTLGKDRGLNVREENYSLAQWQRDAKSGRLLEAFACGTAAVVAPIGQVQTREGSFTIGDGGEGPLSRQLRTALVDIQRGNAPDPHGWVYKVM